ncbi:MAG: conjugal transfer protein TraX [Clostridiales Family XIII bacterium]|jgi:hypothetical protein|nr:conjugal transfer protein TraX [Clostridiales Family XIII bacterium]
MTLNNEPVKWGLTGSQLKYIAAAMMLIDHVHQMFAANGVPDWFTWIGRPVAPIFIFLCAEGFFYTHSRKKYMLQLFIGYEFMSIASTLLETFMPNENIVLMNNIFETMFLITVYSLIADLLRGGIKEKKISKFMLGLAILLISLAIAIVSLSLLNSPELMLSMPKWAFFIIFNVIPNVVTAEGGVTLVLMGLLFYLFREKRILQIAVIVLFSLVSFLTSYGDSNAQWLMVFAALGMLLYNGKRGSGGKYFFYVFYPAHIYILYILACLLY